MSDSVPFGKYKGRPVEEMLADAGYMQWLEAQPWFRERFGHLKTAKDQDAMSRTPVHNRLQALFLDPLYQQAFVRHVSGQWVDKEMADAKSYQGLVGLQMCRAESESAARIEEIAKSPPADEGAWYAHRKDDHERKIEEAKSAKEKWGRLFQEYMNIVPEYEYSVGFESGGADVWIRVILYSPRTSGRSGDFYWRSNVEIWVTESKSAVFHIEIKPTVADEYPAVLRQMNRNKSEYLFVDRYEGEGATQDQFVAMFKASGKTVVFKRDVDAIANA